MQDVVLSQPPTTHTHTHKLNLKPTALDYIPSILLAFILGLTVTALVVQRNAIIDLNEKLDNKLSAINLSIKESETLERELGRDNSILTNQLSDCAEVRHGIGDEFLRLHKKIDKISDKKK